MLLTLYLQNYTKTGNLQHISIKVDTGTRRNTLPTKIMYRTFRAGSFMLINIDKNRQLSSSVHDFHKM